MGLMGWKLQNPWESLVPSRIALDHSEKEISKETTNYGKCYRFLQETTNYGIGFYDGCGTQKPGFATGIQEYKMGR